MKSATTLGYAHVLRSEHAPLAGDEYVELMLDGHTFEELCRPQRRLYQLASCPSIEEEAAVAASLADELGRTIH